MVEIAIVMAGFLIWFGVMAETAPTLDYMADDR